MNTKTTDGFVRQPDNPGAAMNTDHRGLEAYKRRKERENKINTLEQEVSQIKVMLEELISISKENK